MRGQGGRYTTQTSQMSELRCSRHQLPHHALEPLRRAGALPAVVSPIGRRLDLGDTTRAGINRDGVDPPLDDGCALGPAQDLGALYSPKVEPAIGQIDDSPHTLQGLEGAA